MIRDRELTPNVREQVRQAPGDEPSPGCPPLERRRERRYTTNDPVAIKLLEAGGGPPVGGQVLDVSRNGLRLELPTPIGKGLRVQIVLPDRTIIFGETRYCRHVAPTYHVGVAIEVVYYAQAPLGEHFPDTELDLYLLGMGLTAPAALYIENHLLTCQPCQARLAKAQDLQRSCSGNSGRQ